MSFLGRIFGRSAPVAAPASRAVNRLEVFMTTMRCRIAREEWSGQVCDRMLEEARVIAVDATLSPEAFIDAAQAIFKRYERGSLMDGAGI